ncbi:MAG: hypothetical protein FJ292_04845 [Planctomycetes bacterium]|nr:hypothetical protein [Planctomycetota bacterium]
MFFHTGIQTAVLAAGLMAATAHGEMAGGLPTTVKSPKEFVTTTGAQPNSGFGFLGDLTCDGADRAVTTPFVGWQDFGLAGDRPSVGWDFSAQAPDHLPWWLLTSRSEPDRILAGLEWNGSAWAAVGAASLDPAGVGQLQCPFSPINIDWLIRLINSQTWIGPEGRVKPCNPFPWVVPAPGTAVLLAAAFTMSRRRR